MPKATALPAWQRAIIVLTGTVVGVVVLACLYFGQSIFMPVALAIFLTFLLSPLVTKLQRCGLGRVPSVIVVVLLSAIVLTGGGYIIGRQLVSLVEGLSQYSDNMKAKANNLRQMGESEWARKLGKIVEEINDVLSGKAPPPVDDGAQKKEPDSTTSTTQPQTVIVRQTESTPPWLARASSAAGSVTESLVQALLTGVLVIFMLLKREDMRNRLLRLAGHGRLTAMTKAVDEAGQRVSRFLVTQAVINILYGLVLSFGLFLIGIDHALLWGFLVALMRYIPYVGIWIGALPPILLSLAQFPGWWHPALVFALFLVLELVTSNLLEPRFFGQSIGVSEVALLVAAAFWGWMWGPIGLVLSSPLTVVLVVMGKYIPNLEFLDVLLGDEPPLDPKISYYQRLLARDQDEAAQLVQEQAKVLSPEHVYDELLIPTLSYVKRDRENNNLDDVDEAFILHATQEIVEDLGELKEAQAQKDETELPKKEDERHEEAVVDRPKTKILGFPGQNASDGLALEMLHQLLDSTKWDLEIAGSETMSTDLLAQAVEKKPLLICISALPPGGLAHTRYLCKRLRARLPKVKIVVGRWGLESNVEQNKEQLREAGVDEVETTLLGMRDRLKSWLPVLEVMEDKKEKKALAAAV